MRMIVADDEMAQDLSPLDASDEGAAEGVDEHSTVEVPGGGGGIGDRRQQL